jgi:hypothetical protein
MPTKKTELSSLRAELQHAWDSLNELKQSIQEKGPSESLKQVNMILSSLELKLEGAQV